MDDQTFRLWARIDASGRVHSHWGLLAVEAGKIAGVPAQEFVEEATYLALEHGELRPLGHLVRLGCPLPPRVALILAAMIFVEDGAEDALPYRLVPKRRAKGRPGRRSTFEALSRDMVVAEMVKNAGGKYEHRIEDTAKASGVDADTVRKAYDPRYGREARKRRDGKE